MLYTKFQDHLNFGSGEEFLKVFNIWNDSNLSHVTKTIIF